MAILATNKQIAYLQVLADKAEHIKSRHPSLIPQGLHHIQWDLGITSEKASNCIKFYQSIISKADLELHPRNRVAETEDLPA